MTTTISTIRARVRKDLHDEDSDRWSDDELDRHIQHAVLDISQASPLEARDISLTIPDPDSREIDISGIDCLVHVEAVEYPTGEYPRRYREFRVWANRLELLTSETPTAGESLYLYYGKVHTVDADGSTLPPQLEDLCAVGAGAFAALEWASAAASQVNIGGDDTPRHYLDWAERRLDYYHRELKRCRRGRLTRHQLYTESG